MFWITHCRALNTMVYYGLSYNTPNLDGDMYVNFFIGQMVEIPSVAVTMWVIYRYDVSAWCDSRYFLVDTYSLTRRLSC